MTHNLLEIAKNLALTVLGLSIFWFILNKIFGKTEFIDKVFTVSIGISLILVLTIFILLTIWAFRS